MSDSATETMTWDKESRMLTNSLANASYVSNGFDARVSKTVSSTTTTFKRAGADPVSPVLSDVAGSTTTNYLPGISSRVGSTSTFNHSGIKNGILQTNSSQSNTATKHYDAFGNELSTSGTWQTRFDYGGGFGYQRDDESGYKLLGHRYYDPEIGRFLTRDPIKDGRNWYAYCSSDPLSYADPKGLIAARLSALLDALVPVVLSIGGSEGRDPEGRIYVVGGVASKLNPAGNAMTIGPVTFINPSSEERYLSRKLWRLHEHFHSAQYARHRGKFLLTYAYLWVHSAAAEVLTGLGEEGRPLAIPSIPWKLKQTTPPGCAIRLVMGCDIGSTT